MDDPPDSYARWQQDHLRIDDWDATFRAGRWDYLADIGELPRYAVVAGYIHRIMGGGAVLDAGCGEGILADYLDLERCQYTGFDFAPSAVERARKRLRRGTLLDASIEDFAPAASTRYDAIVFNECLQVTDAPLESLDRYRGFVAEGGIIAVSLFKNPNQNANGPRLARFLAAECERGRYSLVDRAEAVSVSHGLAWQIFILR